MPEIRRESLIMLGSLLTIKKGLAHANTYLYEGLKKLLFDANSQIRYRVLSGKVVGIVFAV